ncbi:MAG TPA: pyridoxal-dependent decarboxylase [Gemmatimonadales bacterium]|nr:pyridoxal-dependent decarboxylase [Gemmatimonadales bacterium]
MTGPVPDPFAPSPDDVRVLGEAAADWVARHFGALGALPVIPDVTPAETFARFAEPLPELPTPWPALLERFERDVVPASFHLPSPRYFGLMNPTPLPVAVFAEAMAAALNQNVGAWHHSPAATAVERVVVRWLCDLAGYPASAFGSLTPGGSLANTTGLKIALAAKHPETTARGVWGLARRPVLYASSEAHFSIVKSANILGLGSAEGVRTVPVDRASRMDVGALRRMVAADRAAGLAPFCVVGIAGVTSNGVIDPLERIADAARELDLWFHVDAAYAAGALMSEALRPRLAGIERADSITMDPHKWWAMPYPCGAILTRDGEAGRRAFWADAVYIPQTDDAIEFRDHGLAGSRPFSALKLWMGMKLVGRRAYGRMAEEQVRLTERFAHELTRSGDWELVTPVDTAIAAVRFTGKLPDGKDRSGSQLDSLQDKIVARVLAKRRWWISPTTTVGRRAIRVMVISYLTRWEHLQELLRELRTAAREA